MNPALITAIAEGNFSAILNITSQLTDSERYSTITAIRVLDPYSEKDFPQKNVDKKDTYRYKDKIFQALNYALITMVREESDIAKVMINKENTKVKILFFIFICRILFKLLFLGCKSTTIY